MEEKTKIQLKQPQHFFKIILQDSHQLSIPIAFMGYLKGEKPHQEAILKSSNIPGRSWRVKVEGRKFQEGWKEFVQAHDLCYGDLLVFTHQGGMVFHVIVFDSTACEKRFPKKIKRCEDLHVDIANGNIFGSVSTASGSVQEQAPFISIKMQPYHVRHNVLYIPAKFAKSNSLINKCCMITIRDETGSFWQLKLNHKKSSRHTESERVYISGGWAKFSEDNKLQVGDICTFKLVSTGENVEMQVLISRSNRNEEQERNGHNYVKDHETVS